MKNTDIVQKYFPNGRDDINHFFDHDHRKRLNFDKIFYQHVSYIKIDDIYEQKILFDDKEIHHNFLNVIIFNYTTDYNDNIKVKLIKMLDELDIQFPLYFYSTDNQEILTIYHANIKRFRPRDFTRLTKKNLDLIIDNMYSSIINIGVLDTDHFSTKIKQRVTNFILFLLDEEFVDIGQLKQSLILRFNDAIDKYINNRIEQLYETLHKKLCNIYKYCYLLFIMELFDCLNKKYNVNKLNSDGFNVKDLILSKCYQLNDIYHSLFFSDNNYAHFLRYKNLFDNRFINERIILQHNQLTAEKISPEILVPPLEYDQTMDYLTLFIDHSLFLYILYPNLNGYTNINSEYIVDIVNNKYFFQLSFTTMKNIIAKDKDHINIEHRILGSINSSNYKITKENIIDNEINPLFIANLFWLNSYNIIIDIKFPDNEKQSLDDVRYLISCFDEIESYNHMNFDINLIDKFHADKVKYFFKIIYLYKYNPILIFNAMCLF